MSGRTPRRALDRLVPNREYYGWTIALTGLVCSALSSPGQSFALSLYVEHFITDIGLSRVGISSLYALATLAAAAALPLLGFWSDRTTARRFMRVVLAGMALALVLLAGATSALVLGTSIFALRLLGQGGIGLGTLTATGRWFRRYRGRALAVVALGYAVGELVFPGLIVLLTEQLGWRGSLVAIGAAYAIVATPIIGRFLRERHAEDLPVDGIREDGVAPLGAGVLAADRDYDLRAALRTRTFWAMLATVAISPMLLTAVIFHQVALFNARGWRISLVPTAFAAYALAGVLVTYAAGLWLERTPVRFGVTASLVVATCGLGWYAWGPGGTAGALGYGTLLGVSSAIASATNGLVWPEYFGIRALGALKGVVNAVRNGATAAGPLILAALGGSGFGRGLVVLGVIAMTGAITAAFILPPPQIADTAGAGMPRAA